MTTDPPAHTVMKHIQISILLSISLLLTVSSCGQQQAWDGGLISVQYDRLPQGEDFLLSDWVGEPEFIALDSDTLEAITSSSSTEPPASSCAISATSDAARESIGIYPWLR